MEERTTVEKKVTTVPGAGTTNVNIDANTGATTVERNEPVVEETTVKRTTTDRA